MTNVATKLSPIAAENVKVTKRLAAKKDLIKVRFEAYLSQKIT